MEEMAAIFGAMGFAIVEGRDTETDWFNFGALNIPAHHPARADHDTFYLPAQGNMPPPVLRTHTRITGRAVLQVRAAVAVGQQLLPAPTSKSLKQSLAPCSTAPVDSWPLRQTVIGMMDKAQGPVQCLPKCEPMPT